MKADGSLKSLLQGVSQQPTRDRLAGQCTEQINMSADPVKGLTRRPGDDLVGSLGLDAAAGWGQIQTQDGRQFIVKVTSTGPKVFDYNANEYPVAVSGDMSYWTTPGKWSIASIKKKTYFANSGVVTSMRSETAIYANMGGASSRPMGIVQFLGGNYGRTYAMTINGNIVASFKTLDGSNADHSKTIGTGTLATMMRLLLVTPVADPIPAPYDGWMTEVVRTGELADPNWVVTRREDILLIRRIPAGAQFTMTITDDAANINAKAMTNSVPDVADLPRFAPHNYVVRQAAETDPEQDLWLRFVSDVAGATTGSNFGDSGAWYETVAPNIPIGFTQNNMPRVMTFDTVTETFTVGLENWADRSVGTDITNPTPSFIGYGITDVTTFQNRLVFLGGPNLVASRTNRYENFWLGSANAIADSDPLDFSSQSAFATAFEFAVPHNKDLVIFSPKGQFIMFGRSAVTPKNAAIVLTTSFEADLTARPSACGRNVFFATRYGRFTGVREFFTEGGTDINDTRPITQHVKSYIRGGAEHMSSTSNYDTLLVHTDTDRRKVYPYQFIWSDNEKVQSAWHTWEFPVETIYSFFDDEVIYFIELIAGEYFLLRMSLDVLPEESVGYHVHLSNRFDVSAVNTQFVLPFDWISNHSLIVVQSEGCPNPGLPVRVTSVEYSAIEAGWVVTLRNDMEGGDIVVGIPFVSDYWPTMPRMKDQDGVVISNARLIPNQFLLSLEQTGHIIGQKKSKYGDGPEVPFEGYIVASPQSNVGQVALDDYIFKMPFKEKVENADLRFYTDKHWPMTILDIEWEGTANKRGRRISTGE